MAALRYAFVYEQPNYMIGYMSSCIDHIWTAVLRYAFVYEQSSNLIGNTNNYIDHNYKVSLQNELVHVLLKHLGCYIWIDTDHIAIFLFDLVSF